MIQTTQRFHVWLTPEEYHNGRDEETIARENLGAERGSKMRWIDPQGDHEVLGPGKSLRNAFEFLFGECIAEYNANQKRADRKMTVDGYMQSVENDRRGRPVSAIKRENEKLRASGLPERKESGPRTHYEVVFSLGNVKPLRGEDGKIVIDEKTGLRVRPNYVPADVIRNILRDYIENWDERNPNLYLRRADFHNDEWYKVTQGGIDKPGLPGQWLQGQSHGHLDFIPWAEGYKRGLSRQVSITKAFEAMGFRDFLGPDGKKVTAWEQWQAREQEVIREIARNYGYEVVPAHDSRDGLAADEYAELEEVRGAVQDARADLAEVEARTADLEDREAAVMERETELDVREQAVAARERAQEEQRERLARATADFTAKLTEAHDLDERLPKLRRQTQDEQKKASDASQACRDAIESATGWNRTVTDLQAQEAALRASIAALQDEDSDAYKAAYAAGYAAGQKSPTGQLNRLEIQRKQELTDEQRQENAKRDGIGRV